MLELAGERYKKERNPFRCRTSQNKKKSKGESPAQQLARKYMMRVYILCVPEDARRA